MKVKEKLLKKAFRQAVWSILKTIKTNAHSILETVVIKERSVLREPGTLWYQLTLVKCAYIFPNVINLCAYLVTAMEKRKNK